MRVLTRHWCRLGVGAPRSFKNVKSNAPAMRNRAAAIRRRYCLDGDVHAQVGAAPDEINRGEGAHEGGAGGSGGGGGHGVQSVVCLNLVAEPSS